MVGKRARVRAGGRGVVVTAKANGKSENGAARTGIVTKKVQVGKRVTSFARALASSQRKVRDTAFAALEMWLESHHKMSDDDMDKLWKALFYFVWMTDKQTEIAKAIQRVVKLADAAGMKFLRGLFRCVVTEWHRIDRLRVDKFYALLTAGLDQGVQLVMTAESRDEELVDNLSDLVTAVDEEVFQKSSAEGKGVCLHILDKWIEHVLVVIFGKEASDQKLEAAYEAAMDPLFALLRSRDVVVPRRAITTVDLVLENWLQASRGETDAVFVPTIANILFHTRDRLFEIASDKDAPEAFREDMYKTWARSKTVCAALAADEAGKRKQRELPNPRSNASRKKAVKETKLKKKEKRRELLAQRNGAVGGVAANDVKAKAGVKVGSKSAPKSGAKVGGKGAAKSGAKVAAKNGGKAEALDAQEASAKKSVRFSLENNEVHILPRGKKRRRNVSALFL